MFDHVLLTVRGATRAPSLDAARALHNATAGHPAGVAAARSLGDYSHKVYVAVEGAQSSARAGELLFQDVWESPDGISRFFSDPDVQAKGGELFSAREATVWMPARGAFGFDLPAPAGRTERYVGMIRGAVTSPEAAIAAFAKATQPGCRDARRRGQMSHALYVGMPAPGATGPVEILGVDLWFDAEGMAEHYRSMDMSLLGPVFAGRPDASIWTEAPGAWVEW